MSETFEARDIYLRTDGDDGPVRRVAMCAGGLAIHASLGEYAKGTYTVTHIASGKALLGCLHMKEAKCAVLAALASGLVDWTLDEKHLMKIAKKKRGMAMREMRQAVEDMRTAAYETL